MMAEIPREVKKLVSKSDAGDYISSYQLAKIYNDGIAGVDIDISKSAHYKERCANQLLDYKFSLQSLKLINYKGFQELDISFSSSNTTILVGNNGSGKSTILDAIQKTLTHISSRLTTALFPK